MSDHFDDALAEAIDCFERSRQQVGSSLHVLIADMRYDYEFEHFGWFDTAAEMLEHLYQTTDSVVTSERGFVHSEVEREFGYGEPQDQREFYLYVEPRSTDEEMEDEALEHAQGGGAAANCG